MLLIVGLGNPGRKYENTRHNIGSRVVSELKVLNLKNVISVKPTTFMNESGMAVKNLLRTHHLKPNNLIVVHDDIDLPIEKIRIVKNRGAAGHKGVESIIKELKTKDFIRLRIGICPKIGKPKNPERFVLEKFTKNEEKIIKEVIKKTVEVVNFFLKQGLERTMSKFNK
jgi:PTH1 family peptidyl-tRNA hydrolase